MQPKPKKLKITLKYIFRDDLTVAAEDFVGIFRKQKTRKHYFGGDLETAEEEFQDVSSWGFLRTQKKLYPKEAGSEDQSKTQIQETGPSISLIE